MPANRSKSEKENSTGKNLRRDPYEVLGVSKNSSDQEIKSTYRKMALKYHPDKNANDPEAADMFKEATFYYDILSEPEKRRQFDHAGFAAVEAENQDLELDLSSLGTINTMFAALFSKLGVPIKTTVSANVLEEALNGAVSVCPLELGHPISQKVEKQSARFYSVKILEEEARAGFVCRVQSTKKKQVQVIVL
ncbi:Chaperone protein dnaJ 16 [Linum grandiflorum]